MSIELLQTMEWSRLNWDLSFENILDLDTLIPVVGQTYPVKFERNEHFAKEGLAFLLWQPPHSELNGWSEKRPSEILKSYVIEGILTDQNVGNLTFDFKVLSRSKLIDFFDRIVEEKQSPLSYIGKPDELSVLQWQDARGITKFKIGKYIYLSGAECESSLDAILSLEDERICLHYSATLHHPAFYQTVITKYYLNKNEKNVFNFLLDQAEEIEDNTARLLQANQVFGAEYW